MRERILHGPRRAGAHPDRGAGERRGGQDALSHARRRGRAEAAASLDLLPVDESLLIEVEVRPQDIDHVQLEQPATIRFNFMNARSTPMVTGTVVYISADAVPDRAGFNNSLDGSRQGSLSRAASGSTMARQPRSRAFGQSPACLSRSSSARAIEPSSST